MNISTHEAFNPQKISEERLMVDKEKAGILRGLLKPPLSVIRLIFCFEYSRFNLFSYMSRKPIIICPIYLSAKEVSVYHAALKGVI